MANAPRNEMWVTCKPCSQTWRIAFLPMEMGKLAKLMKGSRCPKCGEIKDIFMAKEVEIVAALTGVNDAQVRSPS